MKILFVIIVLFASSNTFAKSLDERTSLCFILATQYDKITFDISGGMDEFLFLSRQSKKATQIEIQNLIAKDAQTMGSLQWMLTRLSNNSLTFKDLSIIQLLKKSFPLTIATPDAYEMSNTIIKSKLKINQAEDFRKVRNEFMANFLKEYNELCTKDSLVSTSL